MDPRDLIARRIAFELDAGMLVNLGVGIPTRVPKFLPAGVKVWLQSENGIVGFGPPAAPGEQDRYFIDAGKVCTTVVPGGSVIDSALSFGLIRGGHLDFTVLGALQVDQEGNLANWIVPGGKLAGMGGAMDLVCGARTVIVATEHCAKDGSPKIMKKCTYPLTGAKVVDLIVTELAVVRVTDRGLVLAEIAPDTTVEEVLAKTEAPLVVSDDLKVMPVQSRPEVEEVV